MNETSLAGWEVLPAGSAAMVDGGGIILRTGSAALAYDIGRVVGYIVGSYVQVGRMTLNSGGLTGGNPWKDRYRF